MYSNQKRYNKFERLRTRVRAINAQLNSNRLRVNHINRQIGYLNRNVDNSKISLYARTKFAADVNRLVAERNQLISESRGLLAELRRINATRL